jgi:GNAT superfamily N-acetyltransferase
MFPSDDACLDNPVHAALCGPQARFAQVCGHALRHPADVAPFLALPSEPSREDWLDAADRGHGMASRLVGALIAGIQHRSERALLHVLPTNTNAICLYEKLGFRERRKLTISVLTR